MGDENKTTLMPPIEAVRMVWTCTGKFSKSKESSLPTFLIEKAMEDIRGRLEEKDEEKKKKEKEYLDRVMITINAKLRTIQTFYNGRNLNFDENEQLRQSYLESVKETVDFGNKLRDLLKSLPTITIGGVGGATLAERFKDPLKGLIERFFGKIPVDSNVVLYCVVLLGIAVGFVINEYVVVKWARKRKQMLYVIHDYERNIYYESYLEVVAGLLESLFLELDHIHKEVFDHFYSGQSEEERKAEKERIKEYLLTEMKPRRCCLLYDHMKKKRVTPGVWAICETGFQDDLERCPHWRYAKGKMGRMQTDYYRLRNVGRRILYLGLEY